MTYKRAPFFLAIDTADIDHAKRLANDVSPIFQGIKLGLQFFLSHGHEGVERVMEHAAPHTKLFLDLKLHDIPNTVAEGLKSVVSLKPDFVTVHAAGGAAMLSAARDVAAENEFDILAVTVLTSLEQSDLYGTPDVAKVVGHYAETAIKAGCGGLVCAAHEVSDLRQRFGGDVCLVTPGLRLHGGGADDQKRVMTPREALDRGASYGVIGRAVTGCANPVAAAQEIYESCLDSQSTAA